MKLFLTVDLPDKAEFVRLLANYEKAADELRRFLSEDTLETSLIVPEEQASPARKGVRVHADAIGST